MLEGHSNELRRQNRFIARWMSPLVSAVAGTPIAPEVLLGEKTAEEVAAEEQAEKIREGQRREKQVMRKLKKLKG